MNSGYLKQTAYINTQCMFDIHLSLGSLDGADEEMGPAPSYG